MTIANNLFAFTQQVDTTIVDGVVKSSQNRGRDSELEHYLATSVVTINSDGVVTINDPGGTSPVLQVNGRSAFLNSIVTGQADFTVLPWAASTIAIDASGSIGTQGSFDLDLAWNYERSSTSSWDSLAINGHTSACGISLGNTGITFRTESVYNSVTKPTGRMQIATSGDIGIPTAIAARKFAIEQTTAGGFTFDFRQSVDVASGVVIAGSVAIGTNATNPGTDDYWILFRKGDMTTVGSIRGTGAASVNFQTTSDERLKKNIKPASPSEFDEVDWVQFQWRDSDHDHYEHGIIAQRLLGTSVSYLVGLPDEHSEYHQMNYTGLVPVIGAKVADLQYQITALQEQINA